MLITLKQDFCLMNVFEFKYLFMLLCFRNIIKKKTNHDDVSTRIML